MDFFILFLECLLLDSIVCICGETSMVLDISGFGRNRIHQKSVKSIEL